MTRNTCLFLVLILLAVFVASAHAQDQTTLLLPEADISLNATTIVDVILECPASNCIGIDVTVAYDAEVIAVEEITAGEFLGDSARIIVNEVESEGTFRFSALASGGTTRSSDGVIFRVGMTGLALGESELTVTSLSIFRRGGTVQASIEPGLIRVTAGTGELPIMRLTRRLTVRSGAGPQFDPVGTAEPNVDLQVVGVSEDGAWYLIAISDEAQGWIAASRFITFEGDINQIPIVTEQTETEVVETTDTPESPTPTDTPSPEPTLAETESTEPIATEEPTTALEVEATNTELPTEVPPTLVPTNTPEPPTPTNTVSAPTATLRTDTQAEIAPPATNTPEETDTPTFVPTDSPAPTLTPTNTEPPTPTFTPTVPEPCTVTTTATNVGVHVGPNRAVRATFPANQVIRVTGQQQADDGSLWWQIEPLGGSQEVDRFWVRQSDVTAQGGCEAVGSAESPQVIGGGGGGSNQFAGTFRGGQNSISHTFRVGSAGNYAITCNGSPVYPEFGVGNNRSRGQTTLVLNLTPGSYTLTVFATTQNSAGQTIGISSYNCSLARR